MTSRPLQVGIILSGLTLGAVVCFFGHKGPEIRSLATAPRRPALNRQTDVSPAAIASSESSRSNRIYARLPLSFEANRGQAGGTVKFLSRGPGYTLFLTGDQALLALRKGSRESKVERRKSRARRADSVLAMRLAGANPKAIATGVDELPGKSNYLIGRDPAKWRTGVPNYAEVRYTGVYPGIDLVYYGNQGQLEYDFVVAPGADPHAIRLDVGAIGQPPRTRGHAPLWIGENGDLVVKIDGSEVRFHKPAIYQPDPSSPPSKSSRVTRHCSLVEGRYELTGPNQVSFELGPYDRTKTLVIDPALSYSTYLGGSQEDEASSIAIDSSGNAYVVGFTVSANFPTAAGAFDTTCGTDGNCNGSLDDVFVTKLNPTGTALVYSTFVGGSNSDFGYGLAIDSSGDAYVTGTTYSSDFPVTSGAFQKACAVNCSDGDGFVLELNPTGSALIYSTYLGGSAYDQGNAINVDSAGNAYVFGYTGSRNFPVSASAFQRTMGGVQDAFVTKVNGSSLIYSTYLGGSGPDLGFGLTVDGAGNVYVVGQTNSSNFPVTPGAFQTTLGGLTGAFVTKLNSTGSALIFSTYLNGTSTSTNPCAACATDVGLDSNGNVYVSGLTYETNFPVTAGAFQTTFAGGFHDAFVTKLNRTGTALVYSTYVGGTSDDGAVAIAVDSAGDAYLHGNTYSTNFPTTPNAFQPTSGGPPDSFVAELDPTGAALLYSSYLGGSGNEFAKANRNLALDRGTNPDVYVTGFTSSSNFPTTAGAFQTALGGAGSDDAFVTKFAPFTTTLVLSPTNLTFPTQLVGTPSKAQTATLTNDGKSAVSITSISITGANSSDFSETNTCGTSIAAGASCTISVTFKPTSSGARTATVSVADSAAGSPQTVSLTGTGTFVKLAPGGLNFGSVPVGQTSSAMTVTLTNGGTTTLSITSIKFSGTNPGDFSQTNTCGASVAAHGSCTINVTFKPTATGSRSANLGVSDNGGGSPQLVPVSGTGT